MLGWWYKSGGNGQATVGRAIIFAGPSEGVRHYAGERKDTEVSGGKPLGGQAAGERGEGHISAPKTEQQGTGAPKADRAYRAAHEAVHHHSGSDGHQGGRGNRNEFRSRSTSVEEFRSTINIGGRIPFLLQHRWMNFVPPSKSVE